MCPKARNTGASPGKFKSHRVVIDRNPVIRVPDHKDNIEFAMHIGNREVTKRLGIDVSGIKSLDILYEMLRASEQVNVCFADRSRHTDWR